jgi:hypothetical protein
MNTPMVANAGGRSAGRNAVELLNQLDNTAKHAMDFFWIDSQARTPAKH